MGYEDGKAGRTGKIGEAEAANFLQNQGFICKRPAGLDKGIDLIITSNNYPGISATAQVKGRRQIANPRWFQLSITSTSIQSAWDSHQALDKLWVDKIRMVDFWIMVSVPLSEIWVFPSEKVIEIAKLNTPQYITRIDNQYDKISYDKHGKVAKKQKELNLDVQIDGTPVWTKFVDYRNQYESILVYLKQKTKFRIE